LLGVLAVLGAALSLVMFLRSRDQPNRVYWLGYGLLSVGILVTWVLFLR
jgi:hypothetical protein